jgi:DNA-binding transcriptional regulator LsrR (DeoR family)
MPRKTNRSYHSSPTSMIDDPRRLLRAARLYFREDKSKTEIANLLHTSPTHIERMIKRALDQGIVQIVYSPPRLEDRELQLMKRFPCLQEAIVVPSEQKPQVQRQSLGKAAALYFEAKVTEGVTHFALGGGWTLLEMALAVPEREREITLCPAGLLGRGPKIELIDPAVIVHLLWGKCVRKSDRTPCATAYCATVLPFEESASLEAIRQENAQFLSRSKVREVHDQMRAAEVLLAGVGSLVDREYQNANPLTLAKMVSEMGKPMEQLRQEGAVGDLAYAFFDAYGRTRPEWDFFISIGINDLRRMAARQDKRVVAIGAWFKVDAVRAVLIGELCNALIIDERAATELVGAKPGE